MVPNIAAAVLDGGDQAGENRSQSRQLTVHVWLVPFCRRIQSGVREHSVSQPTLPRGLGDAVKDGLLGDNPARSAIVRPRRRPELQFWTSMELAAFLSWLDATGTPHDKALHRLAAQTGMRRGELLGLRSSSILAHQTADDAWQ